MLGAMDTRRYPRAGKPGLERPGRQGCGSPVVKEDHEEKGSKDRAARTCGPHSDSFNDRSRRRRSNCSTNNLKKQILNPSALSIHSL
ncbi:hypothetical protein TNCV_1620401 [Trichonephila clavipes]|nr:hypothetical protein TNCV_1620401 [Trichonephila clavipes]